MTHATKKQCTYFPCNKRLSLDRDFWQSSPHFLFTELLIKYLLGIGFFLKILLNKCSAISWIYNANHGSV